jgi:hypothetical protein
MQLTLNKSSIIEVLEDLQSAMDDVLNMGRFMLCDYRLKHRVDKQDEIVEFMVYRSMMREYRIKGEISKIAENSYNVTASISQVQFAFNLIMSVFMAIIVTGIIFKNEYIMVVPMFALMSAPVIVQYKYTKKKIEKIFKQLQSGTSEKLFRESKDCKFEHFLETGPKRWAYFKNAEIIKRTRIMIFMDVLAVVCLLIGVVCFFYFIPRLSGKMYHEEDRMRMISLIILFMCCVVVVALSVLSGSKRK